MRSPLPALVCGLSIALGASGALADVVHLRDGRTVEGAVTTDGDVVVVRRHLGELRLDRAEVVRIEETEDRWDAKERLEEALSEGTADERYRYASWLRDHGFEEEAREAFLSVLRVDASHPGARSALGYVRHEGRWVTVADRNRAQGLVRHDGEWMTPEEKAERKEAARARARAERERRRAEREAERERRRAERAAEREARRERIEAYERELARARARERAAEESRRDGYGFGIDRVYRRGYYYGRRVIPRRSLGLGCGGGRHGVGRWSSRGGVRIGGHYDGGNWGVRWRIGR